MPGLAGQSRHCLMSAHVINNNPNSLGVPLLACARPVAPETGLVLGGAFTFSTLPCDPRFPAETCFILSIKAEQKSLCLLFVSRVSQTKLPISQDVEIFPQGDDIRQTTLQRARTINSEGRGVSRATSPPL